MKNLTSKNSPDHPSAGEKSLGAPAIQTLRDLVLRNEEMLHVPSDLVEQSLSQSFSNEMEILKGHMCLLENLTHKNSFLVREVKYLIKA